MNTHEHGAALIAALLVFAILYLGLLAWLLSSLTLAAELGHLRRFHRLQVVAEAGLEEALERLDLPSDPSRPLVLGGSLAPGGFDAAIPSPADFDPSWSAAFGLNAATASLLQARLDPVNLQVEIAQATDREDADRDGDRSEPILHDERLTHDGLNNLNTLYGSARVGPEVDDEGPLHVAFGGLEAAGAPLLRVLATARHGPALARLEADAVQDAIWPDPPAVLCAGGPVSVGADGWISGFDHESEVAAGDRTSIGLDYSSDGYDNDGDGSVDEADEQGYLYDLRHQPEGHRAALLVPAAAGSPIAGAPAHLAGLAQPQPNQLLGLSAAAWKYNFDRPRYSLLPDPPLWGWTELGGDGAEASGAGFGVLVARGSLHIQEDFSFRGLMVVRGNLTAAGGFVVGALWVQGSADLGSLTLLYSSDVLRQVRQALRFRPVGWREAL